MIGVAKYIGTKIISAEPRQATEDDKRGNYPVGADGYCVTYEDGYQSWSPKNVFDAAYRRADGLPFGLAIEALKLGKKVARAGWNGKGMWIELIGSSDYSIEAFDKALMPWIGMKTADDKFVPWLASQTDVLAEDWMVIE